MNIKTNLTKCACKNLIGPPPVYLLEPPPMPPLPINFDNLILKSTSDFEQFLKCAPNKILNSNLNFSTSSSNNLKSLLKTSSQNSNFNLNSSYLFVIIVVIVILIVFLLLFILFAFVIVYLTRLKLKKTDANQLNQSDSSKNSNSIISTKKQESPQTVSVLSLTSPSLTHICTSLHTSPNSSNSYNECLSSGSEERNLVVFDNINTKKVMQTFNTNSFNKLVNKNQENTFKPVVQQQTNLMFNNLNTSASSSASFSSTSPNKQSVGNESIETNRTNSTILTVNSRIKNQQLQSRFNKFQLQQQQSSDQQHYYESIGDLSQLYFDVDDPNLVNTNGINKKLINRVLVPNSNNTNNSQVKLNFNDNHYPITCCSCTLMKLNTNSNHSTNCMYKREFINSQQQQQRQQQQRQNLDLQIQNQLFSLNNINANMVQFQQLNMPNQQQHQPVKFNQSSSNLASDQYYLQSLIV